MACIENKLFGKAIKLVTGPGMERNVSIAGLYGLQGLVPCDCE
jgi:hypothetical protein